MTEILWHACGMADVSSSDAWLADRERDRFASMRYPKRRTEAMLGRWTAKTTTCLVLGLPPVAENLAQVVVRNAPDGAPEVFVNGDRIDWVIAMTDRADWAVTALRRGVERIGVDLEVVEERSRRFVEDYFTPLEQASVADGDRSLMANLIWSAKESSLKVLRTGLRRDTRSVEVRLQPGDGSTWSPFTVDVDSGVRHHGWWIRYRSFVLTVAAEAPVPPPESLSEPTPLAGAEPSHGWLAGHDD